MWQYIFLFSCFAAAGCASQNAIVTSTVTLTEQQRQTVEQGVRMKLKDPESARFDQIIAGQAADGITVCGKVNAKNSFGGYTGFTRFHALLNGNQVTNILIDDPPNGSIFLASGRCNAIGLLLG